MYASVKFELSFVPYRYVHMYVCTYICMHGLKHCALIDVRILYIFVCMVSLT